MKGKTCIVSGANAGIGFETTLALAEKGAEIIMLCRNPEKGEAARADIISRSGNGAIHLLQTDLASQGNIRAVAGQIRERWDKIDVLVNNAGTWFSKLILTEDKVETVLAVNHLAYFLLTHELFPALKAAPEARIVCVGSDSHKQIKGMFLDDIFLEKKYHGLRSYAQSKLANLHFTYELDRRLKAAGHENISINCVQPGLVKTDIGLKNTLSLHAIAWKIRRMSGVSPREGAATSIYLASSPEARGRSGLYWDKCEPKPSSRSSYDEETSRRLWEMSLKMCGLKSYAV